MSHMHFVVTTHLSSAMIGTAKTSSVGDGQVRDRGCFNGRNREVKTTNTYILMRGL